MERNYPVTRSAHSCISNSTFQPCLCIDSAAQHDRWFLPALSWEVQEAALLCLTLLKVEVAGSAEHKKQRVTVQQSDPWLESVGQRMCRMETQSFSYRRNICRTSWLLLHTTVVSADSAIEILISAKVTLQKLLYEKEKLCFAMCYECMMCTLHLVSTTANSVMVWNDRGKIPYQGRKLSL